MIRHKRAAGKDSVAQRGHAIYVNRVRRKLARARKGRIVAIDVHSGDYEVADDALVAAARLRERQPKAEVWFERIGYRALDMFHGYVRMERAV